MRKMTVLFYKDGNGRSPVLNFIYSLPKSAVDKVFRSIYSLEEFGVRTHIIGVKKLVGTPMWEVRILGKDSVRVLFTVPVKDLVLVLHGFVKKSQKTPERELRIALIRLNDWRNRR